jgi:hypothetical protein
MDDGWWWSFVCFTNEVCRGINGEKMSRINFSKILLEGLCRWRLSLLGDRMDRGF